MMSQDLMNNYRKPPDPMGCIAMICFLILGSWGFCWLMWQVGVELFNIMKGIL